MKKLFLIFVLTFGLFTSLNAQKERIDQLFEKYQNTEGVTTIKIGKPMFNMLSKLNIDDEEMNELKPMLEKIKNLHILVFEKPKTDSSIPKDVLEKTKNQFNSFQNEISTYLKSLKYEELMKLNNKGNEIIFLSEDTSSDSIDNMLLSINTNHQSILMVLDGKVSIEDINRLIEDKNSGTKNSFFFSETPSSTKTSETISEERNVATFSKINVSSGITVNFTQGNQQKVVIHTQKDKLPYIKTEVSNGTLKIFILNTKGTVTFRDFKIDIIAPKLSEINVYGGAFFTGTNTLKENDLVLNADSGSRISLNAEVKDKTNIETSFGASITLNIRTPKIKVNSSSGSSIKIRGNTVDAEYQISSGAVINAEQLNTQNIKIESSSSASAKINAEKNINATVSSGASVKYKKNTSLLNTHFKSSSGGTIQGF